MSLVVFNICIALILVLLLLIAVVWIRHYYHRRLHIEVTRAKKSEQIKSVFLANVSHALRTPLNSVIGFSDIILKETPTKLGNDQMMEMVNQINQNGHQLLHFITQLLELSNFEGSMLTFTPVEVNLAELMASYRREALRDVHPGVTIGMKTQLSPHCKATLDTNLMHQLMMHLLMNAVKNTYEGKITLAYAFEDKGIRVTITDTGKGVPEHLKDNLFTMLQGEDTLTLSDRASGLGLSICKAIIDALGGDIDITSEGGKGTTVTFWFPCRMRDMDRTEL